MTDIGQIIQDVLAEHKVDTYLARKKIAEECEQKLIAATLKQVALLVNGAVRCDENNNMVIHTGFQLEHQGAMGNALYDYFDK